MANIILTNKCNQRCPYCFADDLLSSNTKDITIEDFKLAIDLLLKAGEQKIGLLGGEPMLHPNFRDIIGYVISKDIFSVIFTNGRFIDKYFDILSNPKVILLVNIASSKQIGDTNYSKLIENLDCYCKVAGSNTNLMLGLNLYDKAVDYSYIFHFTKRYKRPFLRVSLVVPPNADVYRNGIDYFMQFKDYLYDFLLDCAKNSVIPRFDCNKIPRCIFSHEQDENIKNAFGKFYEYAVIYGKKDCNPVLDVYPDLTVARCFAKDKVRVNLLNYCDIKELKQDLDIKNHITNLLLPEQCYNCKLGDACGKACLCFRK